MKIISDTHFGHQNILIYEPNRLKKAKESGYDNVDEFLVDRINSHILENDEVLHLGDVALREGYVYAKKLKGKYTLIKGNHENTTRINYYKAIGWNVIEDIQIEIEYDKNKLEEIKSKYKKSTIKRVACLVKEMEGKIILFSHYPIINDNPDDDRFQNTSKFLEELFNLCNCDINIHGHTHSHIVKDKRCFNASLDANDLLPLDLDEILEKY